LEKKITASLFARFPPQLLAGGTFAGTIESANILSDNHSKILIQIIKRETCRFVYQQGYLMEGEDVKVVAAPPTIEPAFILSIPDDLPSSMPFSYDILIEYIVRLTVGYFQSEQPVDVVAGTRTSRLSVTRSNKWQLARDLHHHNIGTK